MLQQIKAESPSAVIIKTHPTLSLRWNDWPLSCLHTASIITIKKFNQNFFHNGKFILLSQCVKTYQFKKKIIEDFSDRLRFVMIYQRFVTLNCID